jgi:hypothetical protein
MNESPTGLFLYVLLFAAIVLFNYAIRRIDAWRQRQGQQALPGEPAQRVQPAAATARHMQRAAARRRAVDGTDTPVRRGEVAPASLTARTAVDARSLVMGRRNLRRAMIAMTVLGPCKSQEP